MNIDELIARLQEIRSNNGNINVELKELDHDRYGSTIGLVAGEEKVGIDQYFGGEMPLW